MLWCAPARRVVGAERGGAGRVAARGPRGWPPASSGCLVHGDAAGPAQHCLAGRGQLHAGARCMSGSPEEFEATQPHPCCHPS